MKLEKPSFIIPLLELRDSLITVTFKNFQIPGTTDSVGVKFFFSKEGEFFRMESLNKMEEDLWRLSIESLERDMKFGTETILGVGKVENDFQFNSFWTEVCKELSIQDAEEFNMTLLKYKFHNGEVENIIIMNIWGLANPLGISVDIPDLAKNRIRAFFDLKGILVAADNRL